MMMRGILAFLILLPLQVWGSESQTELSPEIMELIHNSVYIGGKAMPRDEFNEIVESVSTPDPRKRLEFFAIQPGTQKCYDVIRKLSMWGQKVDMGVCNHRKDEGYVTVSRFHELEVDFGGGRSLEKEIDAFNQMGSALVAAMYAMPEEITNWDKSEPLTAESWANNRTSAPVFDEDEWYVNYIGHPLAGAFYFTGAKQTGASNWESFGFSVAMSTVQWEFGNEALVENPSWQDLIITPVVGSVLGMGLHSLNEHIKDNDGKWMNSRFLGRFGLVLTDPSGAFQHAVDNFGKGHISDFRMGFQALEVPNLQGGNPNLHQQTIGFGFRFKFSLRRMDN